MDIDEILQSVYNSGRMADKKVSETKPEEILPWLSIDQAKALLLQHYISKDEVREIIRIERGYAPDTPDYRCMNHDKYTVRCAGCRDRKMRMRTIDDISERLEQKLKEESDA